MKFRAKFFFLTYHITDLERFVCHFELKTDLKKKMFTPPMEKKDVFFIIVLDY